MTEKYVAVIELVDNDYYVDNIDELRCEIQKLLKRESNVHIKPMPDRVADLLEEDGDYNYDAGYNDGYNACRDELMKK